MLSFKGILQINKSVQGCEGHLYALHIVIQKCFHSQRHDKLIGVSESMQLTEMNGLGLQYSTSATVMMQPAHVNCTCIAPLTVSIAPVGFGHKVCS